MTEDAGQVRSADGLDAEALAKRRTALAQIRQYPDPALRMTAKPVEQFDAALAQLARRMIALMKDAQGAGLAATQVGTLQRLFVFQFGDDEARAIANPQLVQQSAETEVDEEGCLSMQRVLVPVERSVRVRLEGQDVDGSDISLELEGVPARIVQHEVDHLDGVLTLDRTTPDARREALATLRAQLTFA